MLVGGVAVAVAAVPIDVVVVVGSAEIVTCVTL